jgi:hypothetical protein
MDDPSANLPDQMSIDPNQDIGMNMSTDLQGGDSSFSPDVAPGAGHGVSLDPHLIDAANQPPDINVGHGNANAPDFTPDPNVVLLGDHPPDTGMNITPDHDPGMSVIPDHDPGMGLVPDHDPGMSIVPDHDPATSSVPDPHSQPAVSSSPDSSAAAAHPGGHAPHDDQNYSE